MNRFQLQLATELHKDNPDVDLVQQLDYTIKNGAITFNEWADFKLVSSKEDFLKDNPEATFHVDCVEVIQYLGGYYIQKLSDETFFINDEIPVIDSIRIAQQELWDLCAKELWINEQ